MHIAYGNYGMPHTPYPTMIQQVAAIGYMGLELCVAPGYPTAPDALSSADRATLRRLLAEQQITIDSLLLAKVPVLEADADQHAAHLAGLRQIFELAADLGLTRPIVTSTLGGRIEDWDQKREMLAACVRDWATVAADYDGTFGFEPHVGGIIHTPERARWLLDQVNHPHLKLNFDYSHFELMDIPLADALQQLMPHAVGVHVKDVQGRYPAFKFLLPGEGTLDYRDYVHRLQAAGYEGAITVEISGQLFNAPGYDALAAAQFSYQTLAAALAAVSR
ncbi:MAG: sugar phosphate isomerase/epimerase [Caldilineaceae bacterium]